MKRTIFLYILLSLSAQLFGQATTFVTILDTLTVYPATPAVSGNFVTFIDYRNFIYSLYKVQIDTKQEQLAVFNTGYTEPQISLSGNRIAWIGYPTTTQSDVYVRNILTNITNRLTQDLAYQSHPDIHGNRVVWQDYRNTPATNNNNADIYYYDFGTGQTYQVTTDTSYQSFPAIWGNNIVWQDYRNTYHTNSNNADIYCYNIITGQTQQITTDTSYQTFPAIWGNYIVWEDHRNGVGDIYIYDLNTNTERAISTVNAYKTRPVISGDWILWQDYRNGGTTIQADIYGFNLVTNQEYPIITQTDHQDIPKIDSLNLIWVDFRNYRQDIYHAVMKKSVDLKFQLSVNITGGWNLVSIPGLHPVNQEVNTWWSARDPNAEVFRFNNGYFPVISAEPGTGYWMKHIVEKTYNTGDEWPADGINIYPTIPINKNTGWNLIGGYHYNATVSGISTIPSGSIEGNVFGYSAVTGYSTATELIPGYGYWIKLTQAAQIVLSDPGFMGPSKLAADVSDQWGKIVLTDKAGRHYTLYAASGEVNLDMYELPPAPHKGMFDVRFGSQRYVENLSAGFHEVNFSGMEYPLTIRVENTSIWLQDETGMAFRTLLKDGEEIHLNNSEITKILVSADAIPEVYSLEQNYPNPFNPSTTVRFSIPEDVQNLKLIIYNALGERVAELVNTGLRAGIYNYSWNASDVSSGIYIYQIVTEKFTTSKKMILLK
jgi:beta propeller repeat protein